MLRALQQPQSLQSTQIARRGGGENKAIQYRREMDKKMVAMQNTQAEDMKRTFIASWQAKSAAAVEKIQINNIAKQLEIGAEKQVELRRQKLAELLKFEEEQYAREITASQESSQDKLQRNLQTALQQKQAREEKRKQFAQEQYMRMWRMGCDDLRTLDSEAYDRYVKSEQLRQRDEKRTKSKEELDEEAKWQQLWEDDRLQKLEREKEEAAKKALMTVETRAAVLHQMQEREQIRNEQLMEKARERNEWRERALAEAAEAERLRQDQHNKIVEQGRKIAAWNEAFLQQKKEERRRKEAQERQEMEAQMADYELELRRKRMSVEAMQREMVAYKEFLQARREEERRVQEEIDRVTAEYQAAANAKQDAGWERDRLARERLMQQVAATRDEQVKYKAEQKEASRLAKLEERAQLERDIARDFEAETLEEKERRLHELQQRIDLELQIRQKANMRAVAQANLRNEEEAARLAEIQYRAFVKSEMERARALGIGARSIGQGHGHKSVDWNSRIGDS